MGIPRRTLFLGLAAMAGDRLPVRASEAFPRLALTAALQSSPTIADCNAVFGYFRANEGYIVEYDTIAPLLDSLVNGGYAEHELLVSYGDRFNYLADYHSGLTPPWQLQDFHQNVISLYYNAGGAFQNYDVAIHGGFMALILGPDEATGREVAATNARSFTYEASRLRGLIDTTATSWINACSVYNG